MLVNRRLRYIPRAYTDDDRIFHATIPVGIPARLPGMVLESIARRHRNYRVGKDAVFVKTKNVKAKITIENTVVFPRNVAGFHRSELLYVGKLEQQF